MHVSFAGIVHQPNVDISAYRSYRKLQAKSAALAFTALDLDAPTHSFDEGVADKQPETSSDFR